MKGRLILHPEGAPGWNMAVDEALLRQVQLPVLRLYQWSVPAMSLGYFQERVVAPEGRTWVRRYTGGGLVDHTSDLTYTVVTPKGDPLLSLPMSESYAKIHEGIRLAFEAEGVSVELAACCDPEEKAACFQRAVKFDLVVNGKKVAGAAQRRTREGMLQQGSILVEDLELRDRLRQRLPETLGRALEIEWNASELTDFEKELAQQLETNRYETEAWNQQR